MTLPGLVRKIVASFPIPMRLTGCSRISASPDGVKFLLCAMCPIAFNGERVADGVTTPRLLSENDPACSSLKNAQCGKRVPAGCRNKMTRHRVRRPNGCARLRAQTLDNQ